MYWILGLAVYVLLLFLGYLFISGAWELEDRIRRSEEHNNVSTSAGQIGS